MSAPEASRHEVGRSIDRLEALARLMDGAFVLPGTDIRVGVDGIVGMIPGIGDVVSGVISSYLIWEAKRLGVSKLVIARMVGNTLVDTAIGSIPVLGDVFDIVFKANLRNMALLRKHLETSRSMRSPLIEGEAVRIG